MAAIQAPPSFAQQASANALAEADDAFGGSVGTEDVGLYTSTNVRGFNPQQAGNARIDGVYFDQLTTLAQRLRDRSTIRVGFAALDTFGPSPTGIVAWHSRDSGNDVTASLAPALLPYGADQESIDVTFPVVKDHLSVATGLGHGKRYYGDGSHSDSFAFGLIPRITFEGLEIKPFLSGFLTKGARVRPITAIARPGLAGPHLPDFPKERRHLGQKWADGRNWNITHGVTVKAEVAENLYFRGGAFHAGLDYEKNFTEIYTVVDEAGSARHLVLADPEQDNSANSWESLLTYRTGTGRWSHRIIAGARGRHRRRESGGSDIFDYFQQDGGVPVTYGTRDERPEPVFEFGDLNIGRLRQIAYMAGYIGKLEGVGQINIGINKTDYDASFIPATGMVTHSKANPWLYNASLMVKPTSWLSLYGGIVTGLEDNGSAPENARNRNEQLPALKTKQIDAGLQAIFGKMSFVTSVFQIEKPYFAFDAADDYTNLGTVRHRGIEFSATGHVTERLHVLAGALLMDPVVTGIGVDQGIVGKRPAGTPKLHGRIDLSYTTDLFGGLVLNAALDYESKRAAASYVYPQLGSRQFFLPSRTTVDLGFRHTFDIGKQPLGVRFIVENVFDKKSWDFVASGAFRPAERRSLSVYLVTDL